MAYVRRRSADVQSFFAYGELVAFGFISARNGAQALLFAVRHFCNGSLIQKLNQRTQQLRPFTINPALSAGAVNSMPMPLPGRLVTVLPNQRCLLFTGFEVDQNGYTCRQWSNHGDIAATQADIGKLAAINIRLA